MARARSARSVKTDLKNGLPGIATNLLADRLHDLESAGLVRREEAAPPVVTTLFHLTEAGAQLEPVLNALGGWGIRYMAQPGEGEEFRSHWFAFPVSLFLRDGDPGGPALSIELRTAGRPAVIEVSGGQVRTRLGTSPSASSPDLVLDGPPRLILGLLSARLTAAQAQDLGLTITGDLAVLRRLQPQLRVLSRTRRADRPEFGNRAGGQDQGRRRDRDTGHAHVAVRNGGAAASPRSAVQAARCRAQEPQRM